MLFTRWSHREWHELAERCEDALGGKNPEGWLVVFGRDVLTVGDSLFVPGEIHGYISAEGRENAPGFWGLQHVTTMLPGAAARFPVHVAVVPDRVDMSEAERALTEASRLNLRIEAVTPDPVDPADESYWIRLPGGDALRLNVDRTPQGVTPRVRVVGADSAP